MSAQTPLAELALRYDLPVSELDGWAIASRLSASGRFIANDGLRAFAERLAAAAVLRRAAALVGPLRAATERLIEPLTDPQDGELAIEETVENLLGKPYPEPDDWLSERRVERRQQVVLMVDTSRSMAGPNLALAATATAVLALKLHPGDLSLVAFAAQARSLGRLDDPLPAESLVRRLLAQPCTGPTNIAAALELGVAELERGRNPRKVGLLISDGVYTAGSNPLRAAARFGHLHVMLTTDAAVDRHAVHGGWLSPRRIVGHAVARAGRGHVIAVDGFGELPQRMCDVADRVLR